MTSRVSRPKWPIWPEPAGPLPYQKTNFNFGRFFRLTVAIPVAQLLTSGSTEGFFYGGNVYLVADQLASSTRTGANAVTESYAYDDSGRRLRKTSAGVTTHYAYDGDDIHAERAGTLAGMPTAVYADGGKAKIQQ